MSLREPFFHGVSRWRHDTGYWGSQLVVAVALAAAMSLIAVLLDLSAGFAPRLVEAPIPAGSWAQPWTPGLQLPASEQEASVTRLSATAGIVALFVGLMATGILINAWAQFRRARGVERYVAWTMGAPRRQLTAGLAGEMCLWAGAGLALSALIAITVPAAVAASFPGELRPADDLTRWIGTLAVAALVLAALGSDRSGTSAVGRPMPGFVASALHAPAALTALGFAVASSAGVLLLHTDGLEYPDPRSRDVGVLRASVLPDLSDARISLVRDWLAEGSGSGELGAASAGALRGIGARDLVWIDCGPCSDGGLPAPLKIVRPELYAVGPDTFPFLGIRLLAGRDFDPTQVGSMPGSTEVLVSRRLARRHFFGGRAVGRRLRIGGAGEGWSTVVGVVSDRLDARADGDFAVYVPLAAASPSEIEVFGVAGTSGLDELVVTVPAGIELTERTTGRAVFFGRRWFAHLLGVLAVVGLILIAMGGYRSAMGEARAYRYELALRRALGAQRRHVVAFVARRFALQALGGLVLGGVASLALGEKLRAAAGDLPIVDVRAWGIAGLLVVVVSLAGFGRQVQLALSSSPIRDFDRAAP